LDRVKGKVAIVTGSANGIGEATAKMLAKEGASVAIVDIDDSNGKRVAREIKAAGDIADFWHLDVSQAKEVEKVFAKIARKYGRIDILVNNAGVAGGRGSPTAVPEAELDRVLATNLKGPFFCNKYAVPFMIRVGGGSIVNVASCYGIIGCDTPSYDASKGALRAMTKSDAIVLRKHNIRVNSVHPGNIWTPLFEKIADKIGGGKENTARLLSVPVPLARMGKPEEVAYGILYLASDEASYVTSAELLIDGGMVYAPIPIYPPEVASAPGVEPERKPKRKIKK
jgi:NAD(P)-dependent dehydrogenase (short-subunit alcohol dehydrogenase family)